MICRKYTIVVRGDDEWAFDYALREAMQRMKDGCVTGADRNNKGGFYFNSKELPAGHSETPA